jgi:hypothetical protein
LPPLPLFLLFSAVPLFSAFSFFMLFCINNFIFLLKIQHKGTRSFRYHYEVQTIFRTNILWSFIICAQKLNLVLRIHLFIEKKILKGLNETDTYKVLVLKVY